MLAAHVNQKPKVTFYFATVGSFFLKLVLVFNSKLDRVLILSATTSQEPSPNVMGPERDRSER